MSAQLKTPQYVTRSIQMSGRRQLGALVNRPVIVIYRHSVTVNLNRILRHTQEREKERGRERVVRELVNWVELAKHKVKQDSTTTSSQTDAKQISLAIVSGLLTE